MFDLNIEFMRKFTPRIDFPGLESSIQVKIVGNLLLNMLLKLDHRRSRYSVNSIMFQPMVLTSYELKTDLKVLVGLRMFKQLRETYRTMRALISCKNDVMVLSYDKV